MLTGKESIKTKPCSNSTSSLLPDLRRTLEDRAECFTATFGHVTRLADISHVFEVVLERSIDYKMSTLGTRFDLSRVGVREREGRFQALSRREIFGIYSCSRNSRV